MLIDLYNSVMGAGVVEPATGVLALFIFIFIILPLLGLFIGYKLVVWALTMFRDWWHHGR